MSGPEFFQTRMGKAFYEGTMPRLAAAAGRIAIALERLAEQNEKFVEGAPAQLGEAKELLVTIWNLTESPGEFDLLHLKAQLANYFDANTAESDTTKRDRQIVFQMAKDLSFQNEEAHLGEGSEYFRGQLELLCASAELMATKEFPGDGLAGQVIHIEALFKQAMTRDPMVPNEEFAKMVVDYYFED